MIDLALNDRIKFRLSEEDGIILDQKDASFGFHILPKVNADVEARLLALFFTNNVRKNFNNLELHMGISGVLFFPRILNPKISSSADFISYKRGDNSVFVGMNISYSDWVRADIKGQVELLHQNLIQSIHKISSRKMSDSQKLILLDVIQNIKDILIK